MKHRARVLFILASILGINASSAAAASMHSEIYNLSQFKVFIEVENHPNLNGELAPFDKNSPTIKIHPLDLPKIEYCDNGKPGFKNVMLYDNQHRLAFKGCVLNGEKKYIIDKTFKKAA